MKYLNSDFSLTNDSLVISEDGEHTTPVISVLIRMMREAQVKTLYLAEDLREFIFRVILLYGRDRLMSGDVGSEFIVKAIADEKPVAMDLTTLHEYVGIASEQGSLGFSDREDFIAYLRKTHTASEARKAADKNLPDNVVRYVGPMQIEGEDSGIDISDDIIERCAALAEKLFAQSNVEVFEEFEEKHTDTIDALKQRIALRGSVAFDIQKLPFEVLEECVAFLREEYGYDKELLKKRDAEEFALDFDLIELAWAFANDLCEYEIMESVPVAAWPKEILDLDIDKYQGLQGDEIGGINLLDTIHYYKLAELEPLLKGVEMATEKVKGQ